jgi:hypothetical protein
MKQNQSTLCSKDTLTTKEAAEKLDVKPETLRSAHCRDGHYFSMRPTKKGNRRLLWNAAEVQLLASGGVLK